MLIIFIKIIVALTGNVSGLGATDFFDYLFNTFVSLGIQCFEKTH